MAAPHAFLDILANAQVCDAYLAGRISIILTQDLETILWTNGAGARFMGMRTVAETIGVDSGFDRLTRHQIEAGLEVVRPVRIGGIPMSESFLVNAADLAPLGQVVFLRSVKGVADGEENLHLIDGLSDETTATAVFDMEANILSASNNFDRNWFDLDELKQLLAHAHHDRRVKKRLLQKNPTMPVGVLELCHEPAVFLLIAAKNKEKQEAQTQNDEQGEDFVFNSSLLPLHFGWQVDEEGRFIEVSSELEQAVGKKYADIVGKNFAQLATSWNMDSHGTIRALFKSHNAWGERKVYWPVEGCDFRVEIVFFALPVYSRLREFIGFRGFATIDKMKAGLTQLDSAHDVQIANHGLSEQEQEALRQIALKLKADLQEQDEEWQRLALQAEKEEKAAKAEQKDALIETQEGQEVQGLKEVLSETSSMLTQPSVDIVAMMAVLSSTSLTFEHPIEISSGYCANWDELILYPSAAPVFDSASQRGDDSQFLGGSEKLDKEKNNNKLQNMALPDEVGDIKNALANLPTEHHLMQHIPASILVYRDNKVLFANDHLLQVTGFSSLEAFHEHHILALILREWLPKNILVGANGEMIFVRAHMRCITWLDGVPASMIIFQSDESRQINVLRQDLQKVQKKTIELSNLLNLVSDGVLIVDEEGVIHSLNEGVECIFNISAEAMRGKIFTQFFSPNVHANLMQGFAAIQAHDRISGQENKQVILARDSKQGKLAVEVRFSRMEVDDGYYVLIRDVSDFYNLSTKIANLDEQKRVNISKTPDLSRLSHEIRTPLTAVIGMSEIMLTEKLGALNNDRYRSYLRDIVKCSNYIMRFLEQYNNSKTTEKLETNSRAQSSGEKKILTLKKINLVLILNEIVGQMASQFSQKRIIIRSNLSPDLGAIFVDEPICRRMIYIILLTSLASTPSGGQIILSAQNTLAGEILLRIRDTGIGFGAEEKKAIFEMEPQLTRQTDFEMDWENWQSGQEEKKKLLEQREDKFSLISSLALAKELAQLNKAHFNMQSELGKGTMIEVIFTRHINVADNR